MLEVIKNLIIAAAIAHGVSAYQMDKVAGRESGYDRSVVNESGCVGLYQLCPFGELDEFYKRGYTNPDDPAQQANFAAERFREGACHYSWYLTCPYLFFEHGI